MTALVGSAGLSRGLLCGFGIICGIGCSRRLGSVISCLIVLPACLLPCPLVSSFSGRDGLELTPSRNCHRRDRRRKHQLGRC